MTMIRSRQGLLALGGLGALLLPVLVVPRTTHTGWSTIAGQVTSIPVAQLAALGAVWLVGLYVHSFVSTGALPGLSHRRAMAMNFSGSTVSHLAPFGGVLGVAVSYTMVRSWGFDGGSFTVLVLLTNAYNLAVRLLLPTVALLLLVTFGLHTPAALIAPVILGLGAFGIVAVAALAALHPSRDRPSTFVRGAESVAVRLFGQTDDLGLVGARDRLRADLRAVVVQSWRRMSFGMVGYAVMQAGLLWLCLRTVGVSASPLGTFAAYAAGGALTLVPLTPGGVGFAEAGTAAMLIGLGGNAGAVAAAVLLYSAFTRWMEIPVGAATTTWWLIGRGRRRVLAAT